MRRQYAAIPLIFGACLFIIEYTMSTMTMMKYYYDQGEISGGIRGGGGGEWKLMTTTSKSMPENNHVLEETSTTIVVDDDENDIADAYSWARDNLLPIITTTTTTALDQTQSTQNTTFLFWHIAKSGGTSAKAIYKCLLGKSSVSILSSRADIIVKAKKKKSIMSSFMGFASSPSSFTSSLTYSAENSGKNNRTPEVIFSMLPHVAAMNLFNPTNKGRLLALFRHPVDRLISKFYYLQIA